MADVAGDVDVGEEVHLDLDQAVALAGLAAAALDVEAEAAGLVAARLAFGQAGEPVADLGEGAGVGGRVGAGRAADRRLIDVDHLVEIVEPGDLFVAAGLDAGAVEGARGGGVERVDGERALARAGDAGDAGEGAERDGGGDGLEVVGGGAVEGELPAGALAALSGDGDGAAAGEIIRGQAPLAGEDVLELAMGDDMAAVDAGAGAHVDEVIGVADGVLVMLDDEDGVAEIAQAAERDQQPLVVALVEADRGLVEHVEDARQARADLAGEADALALAARERARGAVEVEIIEADIVEEAEALVDLLEDGAGDLVLGRIELLGERREPGQSVADGAGGGLADMLAGDLHRERLGAEAGAVADLARRGALIFAELLAHPGGFGLEHAAVEIADHAVERLLDLVAAAAVDEAQGDRAALGAVEDDVVDVLRQVLPRRFEARNRIRVARLPSTCI